MLEADAKIIVAGQQGEAGGDPQAAKSDLVDPRLPGRGAAENECAERDQLKRSLPFGERAHRNADANLGNVASQRVMERAGMRLVNETAEKRFYRLP